MMRRRILIITLIIILLVPNILVFFTGVEAATVTHNQTTINANSNNENGISAFPESYQIMLRKLVSDTNHKNWKFKAFYTDIDWNELTSSANENKCGKNSIYGPTAEATWLCICGTLVDLGPYYCASKNIVNYYLDPRNFLTETTIFQFLDLSNSSVVSVADIQKAVAGTYLAGSVNGKSYAEMIYRAAQESGESALSIVVKIFQELGKKQELPDMISGRVSGYEGLYNFFNYGATDGVGNKVRGLEYARKAGWTNPETALVEGAKLIANTYMKTGQNTKYTLKFDVVDDTANGVFAHQYCTNIQDPTNQAKLLYDEYLNNGWLNNELTFVIPVYKNMPAYWKLPSSLNTSSGTLYFISSNYSNVALRSEPSTTSGSRLASLRRNTVVLMNNYNINNSGWSKVTVNGQTGYVTNEYLTPVNTKTDTYKVPSQPADEASSNANLKMLGIETYDFTGFNKNTTTYNTIVPNTVTSVNVYATTDDSGATYQISGNTNLQVGTNEVKITVTAANKRTTKDYYVYVTRETPPVTPGSTGDLNGDGVIDVIDFGRVKLYLLDKIKFTDEQINCVDVNKDGVVDVIDFGRIKLYLLGKITSF